MLANPLGTKMRGNDPFKEVEKSESEPPFRLPPMTAIAGVLVSDWAHQKVVITGPDVQMRGNL